MSVPTYGRLQLQVCRASHTCPDLGSICSNAYTASGMCHAVCIASGTRVSCIHIVAWWPADDENDAVLFEKIKKGEYDADDPIWDNVSVPAKDLVVSP